VDLAVERYRAVIQKSGLTEETLPLHHHLGLILMERGSLEDAHAVLRGIASFRLGYRDVEQILKTCEARIGEKAETHRAAATSEPSSPADHMPLPAAAALGGTETVQRAVGMEALQDAGLLQELTLVELRTFMGGGKVERVEKDAVVIRAGEAGQALYILLEGLMKVTSGLDQAEEILAVLVPGEHFGEMSLLEGEPTSAFVVAAEPSLLFRLDRAAMDALLAGDQRLAVKLYRAFVGTLSHRLRKVNEERMRG
jgi:hypothetical protein